MSVALIAMSINSSGRVAMLTVLTLVVSTLVVYVIDRGQIFNSRKSFRYLEMNYSAVETLPSNSYINKDKPIGDSFKILQRE